MNEYIEFTNAHPLLVGSFFAILTLLIFNLFGSRFRGYTVASPADATTLINRNDAVVLDVRTDKEFNEGHIINSIHIPQSSIKDRLSEIEKHKHKPIIVSCRTGQRSGQVCGQLKKQGFDHVYNLAGGVAAWQNANFPLTKD
ncbi:hypothetical protein MNBD_GAMMA23-2417 [hydrothermal vent metagenome]|uniref:Rhodanese domain-containing protein n=1 Tax=hydrothermal vent metagenome TaxID=652676 RepID=A0A3B1AFC1_9ZZZZ